MCSEKYSPSCAHLARPLGALVTKHPSSLLFLFRLLSAVSNIGIGIGIDIDIGIRYRHRLSV